MAGCSKRRGWRWARDDNFKASRRASFHVRIAQPPRMVPNVTTSSSIPEKASEPEETTRVVDEGEAANAALAARERRERATELRAQEIQKFTSAPVYYVDSHGTLHLANAPMRPKKRVSIPTREPQWRFVERKVYGPTDDMVVGEWEYRDVWVLM